jgi:lysophospholipase L1-like esterase
MRRIALLGAITLALALLTGPGAAGPPATPSVRALFFGDSLFVGSGAVPKSPVQVRTAADRLHWRAILDAWGGTGYTTGGNTGRPYLERLRTDGYLDREYDVIVLEGGTNDARHGSVEQLRVAATATVDYVRLRQPKARIVLVGAYAPRGYRLDRYREVDQTLAQVALAHGLQYVSQFHYSTVTDPGFLSRDGLHPTAGGYRLMGRDLASALKG